MPHKCSQCGCELDVTVPLTSNSAVLCSRCSSVPSPSKTSETLATILEHSELPAQDSDPSTRVETVSPNVATHRDSAFTLPAIEGYRILGVLGRGGMGIVYQAVQERANQRIVAIKMIHDGHGRSAEQNQRFGVEVNAISSVEHPNIVRVYEVGEVDGRRFFTMEYCSGGTLYDRLKKQLMTPKETAALVATLSRAMEVVHQQKIVHRDLKPPNVLYDGRGVPKITDFGLAKEIEIGDVDTVTGIVMGTLGYMSPEQASGNGNKATPETDIYALGAILYSCLTGRVPFAGSSVPDTLQQIQHEEPIAIKRLAPKTPTDLVTICEKCLQKMPSRRYRSVAHLADDLERFLDGRAISARPVTTLEKLIKAARRKPMAAAFWTLLTVSCIGAFAASFLLALANTRERALRREADRYAEKTEQASLQVQQFSSLVLSSLSETDFWTRYFPLFVPKPATTPEEPGDIEVSPDYLRRLKATANSSLTGHPHELAKILVTLANAMRGKMMFPDALASLEEARDLFDKAPETSIEDRLRWKFSHASYLDEVGEIGLAYDAFLELLESKDAFQSPMELADTKVRLAWLCANRISLLGAESEELLGRWRQQSRQELTEAAAIYTQENTPLARTKKQICDLIVLAEGGKLTLSDATTLYSKIHNLPNADFLATGGATFVLAEQQRRAGQFSQSIASFGELERLMSSKLGKQNYLSLLALGALAGAEKSAFERSPDEAFRQQCKANAIAHINEGLTVGTIVSPKHPFLALGYEALAQLLIADNKPSQAIQAIHKALEIAQYHPEDLRPIANRLRKRLKQLGQL